MQFFVNFCESLHLFLYLCSQKSDNSSQRKVALTNNNLLR